MSKPTWNWDIMSALKAQAKIPIKVKAPSEDDIWKLAEKNPILYNALNLCKGNYCTLEEAMRIAVSLLVQECEGMLKIIVDRTSPLTTLTVNSDPEFEKLKEKMVKDFEDTEK
jgi:hypothetical protein